MGIKKFFSEIFKPEPKKYFEYTMLCRKCDILFKRYDAMHNKCPLCGNYMEVYNASVIGKDVYDSRA